MNVQQKNKRTGYIILLVLGLLIFWRYSYFIFVPDIFAKVEAVPKKNLSADVIAGLSIKADTIKNNFDGGIRTIHSPFKKDSLNKTKVEQKPDLFNLAFVNVITSAEFGWKREFQDYYDDGGIVTSNNKYLVVLLNRGTDYDFEDSINVLSGSSGPPPTIYLLYNTSKIHYSDIYFLDRKTGKTAQHFKFHDALEAAFYNVKDNTFYFRFTNEEIYYRYRLE